MFLMSIIKLAWQCIFKLNIKTFLPFNIKLFFKLLLCWFWCLMSADLNFFKPLCFSSTQIIQHTRMTKIKCINIQIKWCIKEPDSIALFGLFLFAIPTEPVARALCTNELILDVTRGGAEQKVSLYTDNLFPLISVSIL